MAALSWGHMMSQEVTLGAHAFPPCFHVEGKIGKRTHPYMVKILLNYQGEKNHTNPWEKHVNH